MSRITLSGPSSGPMFAPLLRGTYYRAIDPNFAGYAIAGSRRAGRYSRSGEPTLYLSSSVEGVEAAMIAHHDARPSSLQIVEIDVEATGIFDLRDESSLRNAGIEVSDAIAPWQEIANAGGTPRSWKVRDRLIEMGANGLIDPSRKRPGLWHLVLFRWNEGNGPRVHVRNSG
ncbi:RES family NAD+ phosphorylase [Paucibacter oligotrophus]|uniref:RES family NAD+ phosphorylase n=1 Tax=Roseateles oligotrophus TaxID=1769250 RepID=UPI001C87571B